MARPGQAPQSLPDQVARGQADVRMGGRGGSKQIKDQSLAARCQEGLADDLSARCTQDTAQPSQQPPPSSQPASAQPGGRRGGVPWHEAHLGRRPPPNTRTRPYKATLGSVRPLVAGEGFEVSEDWRMGQGRS